MSETCASTTLPGGMDAGEFLQQYWQQKTCLFRQAAPEYCSSISREDMFELACRDVVESRLVLERDGEYPWQVIPGPFAEQTLADLPTSHWSLLVQNTELFNAAAAAFLARFNFVPNWRIDDLMISVAPDHGSVGPHLDNYDVFLFQASGRRKWAINPDDYDENDFIAGLDLRIINDFRSTQEWVLEPGDMLYLPPGVAHHGIALDAGMTWSVGFRAPSAQELLAAWVDDCLEYSRDTRYRDTSPEFQYDPGTITPVVLQQLDGLLRGALPGSEDTGTWFGQYITRLPESFQSTIIMTDLEQPDFLDTIRGHSQLQKIAIRSASITGPDHIALFINGDVYRLPMECSSFVQDFCCGTHFANPIRDGKDGQQALIDLLRDLFMHGHLSVPA